MLNAVLCGLWAVQFAYSVFEYGQERHRAWLTAAMAQALLVLVFLVKATKIGG